MKQLGVRTASAAVLLALVLAALWVRGPLLAVLVVVAAGLGAHEFFTMVRHAGYRPWYAAGVALALLLAARGYLGTELATGAGGVNAGLPAEVLAVGILLVFVLIRQGYAWQMATARSGATTGSLGQGHPGAGWADLGLTLGGAVYAGGLLGYAPLLAERSVRPGEPAGVVWLLLVILGTAACDSGAYFVGSAVGRHKLIPHISPGKTWEGLGGGAIGGIVAALAFAGSLGLQWWQAVGLGLVVCAAAVAGDLCESLIKRAAAVKDSSHLIPGHGGILDRVDSILFVLVAVYWFTKFT